MASLLRQIPRSNGRHTSASFINKFRKRNIIDTLTFSNRACFSPKLGGKRRFLEPSPTTQRGGFRSIFHNSTPGTDLNLLSIFHSGRVVRRFSHWKFQSSFPCSIIRRTPCVTALFRNVSNANNLNRVHKARSIVRSSSGSSVNKAKSNKTSSFVASGPLFTTKLVEKATSDPGNLVMNLGAILALSGFMMSDVMNLRMLSISGSLCGITFNLTRKPPQYNAVLWGMVFVSVNLYHLYWLYLERTEDMTFHKDEMLLYTCHFQEWGVEPWKFKKLVKLDGCRFHKYKRGEVVVQNDQPLNDVMMVVKGEIGAEDPRHPPLSSLPLYSYRGDGQNGCVVGGTALVDPSVRSKKYPNRLVALSEDSVVVKWDTDNLARVMQSDKDIESAVLHALYVELIQGLRRDRANKKKFNRAEIMSNTLLDLETMVRKALEDCSREPSEKENEVLLQLRPNDKKAIREYALENRITTSQRENVLRRFGWTVEEWDDGGKLVKA